MHNLYFHPKEINTVVISNTQTNVLLGRSGKFYVTIREFISATVIMSLCVMNI